MSVQLQVHQHFKVFAAGSISDLAGMVRSFTAGGGIAAKSIGIEYVESSGQLLLSLGYAKGQDGYPVTLHEVKAGMLPADGEVSGLEAALENAAGAAGDVICHELYVDEYSEVHMVFMVKS